MPTCIEIHTKGKLYKIQNSDLSRDFNESLDFQIVTEFIRTGILPDGFYCTINGEDADSIITAKELFNTLVESLATKENLSFYGLVNGSITKKDFINNIIGNYKITDVMYNPYIADQNSQGILYVNNLAENKDWFGFTDQRALIITGHKPQLNRTYDLLLNAYYELRDGKSEFIKNSIETLYQNIYGTKLDDIYEMFTILANDHTTDLLDAIRLPYMSGMNVSTKVFKEHFQDVIGKALYHNNRICIIQNKLDSTNLSAIDVETGIVVTIPFKSIKRVYSPFLLQHNNKNYYLLGRTWYLTFNNSYKKVEPILANELSNAWFGVNSNDTKKLNVYSSKVFQNTKLGDSTILEQLEEGSYVQTDTGFYVKENGELINGDSVLTDTQQIISIIYPNSQDELFRSLLDISIPSVKYNKSQMAIIMSEMLNVSNFDNYILKYENSKNAPKFKYVQSWNNGVSTYKLIINLGQEFTEDYYRELQLAINGLNYLNSDEFEDKLLLSDTQNSLNEFWKQLQNTIYVEGKIVTPDGEVEANDAQNYILGNINYNFAEVAEKIEENKTIVKKAFYPSPNIDAFIDELMSKGLYIVSCSL